MPAPITVIIPTLNCAATLGPTLACVFEGVNAGLVHEVVFGDGGSTDDIADLASETGTTIFVSPPGRGTQMAHAAINVKTDWILFLHADTVLSANWPAITKRHISTSQNAAYFRLHFNAVGLAPSIVSHWANLRSRIFQLPYGDQALLIPYTRYSEIGGYPKIPLMEDVVVARKLRNNLNALPITATTSADKYIANGWLKQGTSNILTLASYFLGASPENLAKRYSKR